LMATGMTLLTVQVLLQILTHFAADLDGDRR